MPLQIRNPLGAVILSADSISVSLSQIQELVKQSVSAKLAIDPNSLTRLLEDITESVETIRLALFTRSASPMTYCLCPSSILI